MGWGRIAVVWAFILSAPCWPALFNGQPFFTLDTIAYLHDAARGVSRLLGIEAIWYAPPVAAAGDVGQALPGTQPESHATGSVVLMGRSAPTHDFRSAHRLLIWAQHRAGVRSVAPRTLPHQIASYAGRPGNSSITSRLLRVSFYCQCIRAHSRDLLFRVPRYVDDGCLRLLEVCRTSVGRRRVECSRVRHAFWGTRSVPGEGRLAGSVASIDRCFNYTCRSGALPWPDNDGLSDKA